jgi:DNA-binding transcriptional regulator YiaG
MSDTASSTTLRDARDREGLSREAVTRLLDPPVSSKTLERWEKGSTPVPGWRLRQLAQVYRVRLEALNGKAAA